MLELLVLRGRGQLKRKGKLSFLIDLPAWIIIILSFSFLGFHVYHHFSEGVCITSIGDQWDEHHKGKITLVDEKGCHYTVDADAWDF